MDLQFVFDDGQGNMKNSDCNDLMDVIDELDTVVIVESLTTFESYGQWRDEQCVSAKQQEEIMDEQQLQQQGQQEGVKKRTRKYNTHSNDLKCLVISYLLDKLVSAAQAGREYGVDERTAQRWVREYRRGKDEGEGEGKKKPGRKALLGDEDKQRLIEFLDDNLSAVIDQAMDSLTSQLEGLKIKKTAVHNFMTKE